METVTISKAKYEFLKKKSKKAEIDWKLVQKLRKSFEDIKHGRISEWKPK